MDTHISSLLYDHDCVIVPEFGGFVAKYKSATVHPVQHTFLPPSKQIAFNESLRINDGLLANYVSRKLNISYSEACNTIAAFVLHCNDELSKGKKIVVEKTGTLFFDVEHNLQFIPDADTNYLLDSFGFSSFQSPAVKRDENVFEMADAIPFISSVKNKKRKSKLWRLLEAIPAAAIITWLILNTNFTAQINTGFASLNPFAYSVEQFEAINSEAAKNQKEAEVSETILPEAKPETAIAENKTADENSTAVAAGEKNNMPVKVPEKKELQPPLPVSKPEIDIVKKTASATFTSDTSDKFFVIGGCFSIFENAEKLVAQLKNQGYPALLLGKNKGGLEMVGIASAKSHSKAVEMLGFIQDSGYADAWILRKKN